MKLLIVDTYYHSFLSKFYAQHPGLAQAPYSEQWRALMDQCFGTSDFYSSNLNALGHEAVEIVANCEPLQCQWAKENGLKVETNGWTLRKRARLIPWPERSGPSVWLDKILIAHVKKYRPDVLYIQDMNSASAKLLRSVRPYTRLIVGQIAYPIFPETDFREYDLILSSLPNYVEQFRRDGFASEYLKLGFEPKVLLHLKEESRREAVFIGSLSPHHPERIKFLEKIVAARDLDIWGYGVEALDPSSPLHNKYHGDAWALDMYQVLYNSTMTLNHHIGLAGPYANNMRLFESTGVGTLLITDWKENLHQLFEPGKEVLCYRTAEECIDLINYYLEHEDERAAIARAGQQRTLRDHTYQRRMQELVDILQSHLASSARARMAKV